MPLQFCNRVIRRNLLIPLFLVVVTFGVFSGALTAEFVLWDDDINIYENPRIQGLDAERLWWMFTDTKAALRYKPLSWLSWACIYSGFGLRHFGYHLANLVLHCLNVVFVYFLIQKLLTPPEEEGAVSASQKLHDDHSARGKDLAVTGKQTYVALCSALGALLWAIHPLRVEPVAWVTGLPYGQALCFLLVSLLCYIRANDRQAPGGSQTPYYWASVFAFCLSLLSYPIGLGYIALLLILDSFRWRRFASAKSCWSASVRRVWLQKVPFLAMTALFLGVALYGRIYGRGEWEEPADFGQFSPLARTMQAFYVWAYYLWKFWVPLHLSPMYTSLLAVEPLRLPFVLSATFVLSMTVFLAFNRRRWVGLWALWLSYLVVLVPVLGLTEYPYVANDRYGHLAGILWAIAIAAVLVRFQPNSRFRVVAMSVGVLFVGVLGILSMRQVGAWRDSRTLFNHMLGELGEHYSASEIHCRIGLLDLKTGRTEDAVQHFADAIRLKPDMSRAHSCMASARLAQGDLDAALAAYTVAKGLTSDAALHRATGDILARQGKTSEAIQEYEAALRLKPNLLEALNNLAWLLATHPNDSLRNGAEAVRLGERACELTGYRKPMMVGTLAAAYAEAGRFSDAVRTAQRARDLASAAGESELAATNTRLIELYQAGKPYREGQP